jgi:outer membrane protein, adhesin transport system
MIRKANMHRLLMVVALSVPAQAIHASCQDDLTKSVIQSEAKGAGARVDSTQSPSAKVEPMAQLQWLALEASRRSAQIGAMKLLADAAAFDVTEMQGKSKPQISIGGTLGGGASKYSGTAWSKGVVANASLSASGVIFDGGALASLSQWRREQAAAARFSLQAAQEQVIVEALSAAVEVTRYRQQAQVYQQYSRKMECLVDALKDIVSEDKGRSSELVQARKNQAQAEQSRESALAQMRQSEIRLRKLVGDNGTMIEGIAVPLSQTMDTGEVMRLMEQSGEFRQMRAQADASDRYAEAVAASQRPQVTWVVSGSGGTRGDVKNVTAQAGLNVQYSLFNGGSGEAAAAAAARRSEATRQQYAEFLSTRVSRVADLHESADASFERARRFVEILKDSDKVRQSTFQQWAQLGRRSLFDLMSAEGDHFNLRIAYVNALHDGYQANVQLRSMGGGLLNWLGVASQ